MEDEKNSALEPVWCLVANVVEERNFGPGGGERRRGTKHFAPGAKVCAFPVLWGDGYEKIKVVGRHRESHRFVKMVIPSKWLTNWRAQLVYSPFLIAQFQGVWGQKAILFQRKATLPRDHVEEYVKMMNQPEAPSGNFGSAA